LRSRDPTCGPFAEALDEARIKTSNLVVLIDQGISYLNSLTPSRLAENVYSSQVQKIVTLNQGNAILRVMYVQEILICGDRFFKYFIDQVDSAAMSFTDENQRRDWQTLADDFQIGIEEIQRLHQGLEVRLLLKSNCCLGRNGLANSNDLFMWFSTMMPKGFDCPGTAFNNRSLVSIKNIVFQEKFNIGGTTYQVRAK
jgi:hypothetical protein